jgi:hypothetical protein
MYGVFVSDAVLRRILDPSYLSRGGTGTIRIGNDDRLAVITGDRFIVSSEGHNFLSRTIYCSLTLIYIRLHVCVISTKKIGLPSKFIHHDRHIIIYGDGDFQVY